MNFFRILIGTCSGTSIFIQILRFPFWRAVFHTFLMMFLCSVLVTIGMLSSSNIDLRATIEHFFEQVGAVEASPFELRLKNAPDEEKTYFLGSVRFDYLPAEQPDLKKRISDTGFASGILLMRHGFVVWIRNDLQNNKSPVYNLVFIPPPELAKLIALFNLGQIDESFKDTVSQYSSLIQQANNKNNVPIIGRSLMLDETATFISEQLAAVVKNIPEHTESDSSAVKFVGISSPQIVSSVIHTYLVIGSFLFAFATIFVFLLLAVVFFQIGQYIRLTAFDVKMSWKTSVAILLYASFPPMLIASVFCGFLLPLYLYQMIFLIPFFIYHLIVFGAVMRYLKPEKSNFSDTDS